MQNRLLISLILIFATLAVFFPVRNYDFVSWDDDFHVYDNPYLNPVTVENTLHFWQEPYKRLYVPVTYTLWSCLGWLSRFFPAEPYGLNPHIFHTANLILHLLNTLIVFSFLRLLLTYGFKDGENQRENRDPSKIDLAAGLGAFIFALHPLHVEPVAWVTGMKDILSCMLSLLAVREYLAYSIAAKGMNENFNKPVHYILAGVAYILAVLAKPVAVVLPLVALILDRWAVKRPIKDSAVSLAGWFIAAGLFAIVAKTVQQSGANIASAPLWARPFIAGDALAFYLYKLAVPWQLGIDYGRSPGFVMKQWWIYFTWVVPFALVYGICLVKKREPWLVSIGILFASLLPVLGFVPFVFQNHSTVSDHYLYFPMLGASVLISWIFLNHRTRLVMTVFALVIVLFGIRSAFLVSTWKNETALYQNALKVNPVSALSHNNLGNTMKIQGRFAEAAYHYKKTVEIQPKSVNALFNLGFIYAREGKWDKSIYHYKKAIDIWPYEAKWHNNLGVALAEKGKFDEAASHYRKALGIKPDDANAYNNLGVALEKQGKLDEAIVHYKKAINLQPNDANAHANLGIAFSKQEKYNEAIASFRRALRIRPDHALAKKQMAIAKAGLKKK
jgi:Flp pilus assembly protein TadD